MVNDLSPRGSGTALVINVGGVQVMSRELARFTGHVRDLRPVLNQMAAELAELNLENFDTEGASSPRGRWAPLSPKYREWKEKHYPGQPILVRTGKLRAELTNNPMGVQSSTQYGLRLGTDITYAGYHQSGTPKMPARRPVGLTDQVRKDMVKTLQRYIITGQIWKKV